MWWFPQFLLSFPSFSLVTAFFHSLFPLLHFLSSNLIFCFSVLFCFFFFCLFTSYSSSFLLFLPSFPRSLALNILSPCSSFFNFYLFCPSFLPLLFLLSPSFPLPLHIQLHQDQCDDFLNFSCHFLVRTGRQKTYEIFHVYCIFYYGFMCQTTVIFGITKDGSLVLNILESWNCFTCRNRFQNGANDMSECLTLKRLFVKKLKILYSSDHPILIKFRQLVVNIVIKELQMVFLTSTVINSNGNMKELELKIKCEKLMFR